MILVDKDILNLGEKLIKPFKISHVSPASYDVSISDKLVVYSSDVLHIDEEPETELIEFEKAIFLPPNFPDHLLKEYQDRYKDHVVVRTPVLGSTIEYLTLPSDICAEYTGRSSWARKFLESHMTAGWIDNGFKGTITLEIVAHKPVEIKAGTRIGQILFYKTKKPIVDYSQKLDAKYVGQVLPTPSKAHKDEKMKIVYCDGSVNKNPGTFGIAGVFDGETYYCYAYNEKKLTNNIMEALAIYHAIDHCDENKSNIIVTDSLTLIRGIYGLCNVKKQPLATLVSIIKDKLNDNIKVVHRKGHTKFDKIGNLISRIMKLYNMEKNIVLGSNVKYIECSLEEVLKS